MGFREFSFFHTFSNIPVDKCTFGIHKIKLMIKTSPSSYFLFMNERRPILKKENSDKSMTDISKLISAEWKLMDENDKKPYVDKAAELKEEHKIKMDEYKKSDNFRKYQRKLDQWKEEQKQLKEAESG